MGTDVSSCGRCGFDTNAIAERLTLVELDRPEMEAQGRALQEQVVGPNADEILDRFYGSLLRIDDFNSIISQHSDLQRIKDTQKRYLLGLGVNFSSHEYFEERLRIGSVHQRIGVPQSLYQCTFQGLQSLLIEYIPRETRDDKAAFEDMIGFILKITALDMSLAVESYCTARVSRLKKSLETEQGETERLRKLSITDWLTSLHNHSFSKRSLREALDRAMDEKTPLCVIMADLDHFKAINDAHGHLVGDEVLKITAARMLSGARADDVICRYGGEEFLFILQKTGIVEGEEVAERVRTRIRCDAMQCGGSEIKVTLSLGLAQACEGDTVNSLLARADAALYAAKRAGRDCVRVNQPYDLISELSASV